MRLEKLYHEHLYNFSLINMNGHMYDPVMSGFLSVDQYVQSPGNSQNFNRYAYCLNNPLRYVDPGALANLQDIITGFDGGSYQYQYEKTKGNIGHANIRQVSYDADGETSTIVKISVANQNRIHAKNKLDWLWKCNFKKYSGGGEHWLDVPEQGWERIPLQLNTKIVDWMYHNLENGKGLWGITETRFGINYGCVSYAARALWTTGVPTIPMINYLGPSVLWTQLAIRQFGIQVSPIIIGI